MRLGQGAGTSKITYMSRPPSSVSSTMRYAATKHGPSVSILHSRCHLMPMPQGEPLPPPSGHQSPGSGLTSHSPSRP
jgi:hypothetical protein